MGVQSAATAPRAALRAVARDRSAALDPATTHKGFGAYEETGTSRIRLQGVSHTRCVSPSPQPASPEQRLIIISGEEGAGKSTIVRALLPSTPYGARIDAEDIGQTNPCPMDDPFFDLLRRNVAGLVENFWAAGYVNVIAGSFLRRYSDYVSFPPAATALGGIPHRSPGRQGGARSSADHPGEADHAGMARHG